MAGAEPPSGGEPPPRGGAAPQPGVAPVPRGPEVPPVVPGVPPPAVASCGIAPSPRLRRLSHEEYDNTVADLLGTSLRPAARFPGDPVVLGFSNHAAALRVSPAQLEAYLEAARTLADGADVAKLLQPVPACAGTPEPAACATAFVAKFGRRAFRRSLTAAEAARYRAVFDASYAVEKDLAAGIRLVVRAFLGSSHFLHRTEVGADGRLSAVETASALSYALWGSMPDERLLDDAEGGRLLGDRAAQVARLIADPKAKRHARSFLRQWFRVEALRDDVIKDAEAYPGFSDELRAALLADTDALFDRAVARGAGGLTALLTDSTAVTTAAMAKFYRIPGDIGSTSKAVVLPPDRRAGILTHPSFLSVFAYPDGSAPVHRGKFVRVELLCGTVPPPPEDIPNDAVEPKPTVTTRERFVEHSKNPTCAACHRLIDPIGFALEEFDGVGRFRSTDAGKPVDASGEIVATTASDGTFRGAAELASRLAQSADVQACTAVQMFRFAAGRDAHDADRCALDEARRRFAGGDLLTLMATIATEVIR